MCDVIISIRYGYIVADSTDPCRKTWYQRSVLLERVITLFTVRV